MSLFYVSIKSSHYTHGLLISSQYPKPFFNLSMWLQVACELNFVSGGDSTEWGRETGDRPDRALRLARLMLLAPFLTILAESKNSDKTDNWRWPRLVWLLAAARTSDTLTPAGIRGKYSNGIINHFFMRPVNPNSRLHFILWYQNFVNARKNT